MKTIYKPNYNYQNQDNQADKRRQDGKTGGSGLYRSGYWIAASILFSITFYIRLQKKDGLLETVVNWDREASKIKKHLYETTHKKENIICTFLGNNKIGRRVE